MTDSYYGLIHVPTYLLGLIVIVLLPGPNSLFVLATAAQRGIRSGYLAACGVVIGDTVLIVLASAGVASLLRAYAPVFAAFKYAGAAYLAWLGIKMLAAGWREFRSQAPLADEAQMPRITAADLRHPLPRAVFISLLNPKAILFFVAFFIQFVDPAYPHKALSFALLGILAQSFSITYLSVLIFSGVRLSSSFRRRRKTAAVLTGGAGALFLGFGTRLATASLV